MGAVESRTPVDISTIVRLRTTDPDLGRTIALWVADLLQEFAFARPGGTVHIDDDGLVGRPFRAGSFARDAGDFRAWREDPDIVHLVCSSSSVLLRPRPYSEAVRKLLTLAGATRDSVPLDHLEVVRQQQRVRRLTATAMALTSGTDQCQFLLRVDDFPTPAASSDDFLKFHEMAVEHRVPYLVAVTPFAHLDGQRPLSEREVHILHRCSSEGAELALHGFSHRSRYRNYPSELLSMPVGVLREALDRAETYLRRQELVAIGFVAPYNGYDPWTVAVLAERYALLCGGPESVAALGYRAGPSFLLQSLYVPSYRGVYDIDAGQLSRFDRLVTEAHGLIVPVTLHWANEVRGKFRGFRALCTRLMGRTLRWSEFLAHAARIRSLQPAP